MKISKSAQNFSSHDAQAKFSYSTKITMNVQFDWRVYGEIKMHVDFLNIYFDHFLTFENHSQEMHFRHVYTRFK